MTDANFAEWFRAVDELLDKILRTRLRKCAIKVKDEKVSHSKIADQRDLVLGRR